MERRFVVVLFTSSSLASQARPPSPYTASFYLEVYGRKFEKELLALRKEFEEQQVQLSKYASPVTPPTTTGAGGEEMSRVGSLDALGEKEEEEGESEGSGEEVRKEDAEAVEDGDGFGGVAKPV